MGACAPLSTPEDPLPSEAGFLQRALLGDVVDVGAGLDPLDVEEPEQQLRQQPLCLGPRASGMSDSPMLSAFDLSPGP